MWKRVSPLEAMGTLRNLMPTRRERSEQRREVDQTIFASAYPNTLVTVNRVGKKSGRGFVVPRSRGLFVDVASLK